jgi:hypothetical protein
MNSMNPVNKDRTGDQKKSPARSRGVWPLRDEKRKFERYQFQEKVKVFPVILS